MLVWGMRSTIRHQQPQVKALATWLALVALFWQTLLAAGAVERPMAPIQFAGDMIVICTEHGLETLPPDGAPAQNSKDHSGPSCPCCLPFASGGGLVLAAPPQIAAPAWVTVPAILTPSAAPRPDRVASDPQQPRAPPLSA
jgi:hypothetical protein